MPVFDTPVLVIAKSSKDGRTYIYLDYEPWPDIRDIRFRRPVTHRDIREWVLQEYSLVVISRYITQVKRQHGIFTSNKLGTVPKSVKIPPEKEAAIEAAFRHFGMIPDEN